MIVGVDPGLRKCGVAGVENGRIQFAFLVRSAVKPPIRGPVAWGAMAGAVAHNLAALSIAVATLALEGPKVYTHGVGDPADLVQLAGVIGELHARVNPEIVVYYDRPADWKGTVQGDVMIERIKRRVAAQGTTALVTLPSAKGDHEHVWDACGIALHAAGALEPVRVYPRE